MANLSELNVIITDLFDVLGTVINEVVDLITGDLLVLTIVGAFISLIVGVIFLIFKYLKNTMNQSITMKKK